MRLGELAERLVVRLEGDPGRALEGVGTLRGAGPAQLAFLANPRYRKDLESSRAGAVLLREGTACPSGFSGARLWADDPYLAFARASALLHPPPVVQPGIDPSAVLAPDAQVDPSAEIGPLVYVGRGATIGPGVQVGSGCHVGDGVEIGMGTRLHPRVVVYAGCRIGQGCVLHSGAVIGADGFGLAYSGSGWERIPQVGRVIIGDNVDVGANTTIDRGAIDDTIIEDGVKLDNQIQIGHNCVIGAHTAVAGCVGIAGSTRIGVGCRIGGASMISGHLQIADDTEIAGGTAVTRSIREAGVYASVSPFMPFAQWRRNAAQLRHLDELAKRVRALEQAAGIVHHASSDPPPESE